jgi:alditol oxidase
MMRHRRNWAGNYTYKAARLHYPKSIEEVQQLVSQSKKAKVIGSRHSFNDIADSPGDLISLDELPRVVSIDHEHHTVTLDGGIRYGQLCGVLHRAGYALPNLASLPHISVAGACATATHGSGIANGNLATTISAMELVTADGSLVTLSRDQLGEQFNGAVVSLGGLGAISKLTLDIIPAFDMRQDVYEKLDFAQLEEHFDEIVAATYSVSLFTDWRDERMTQVWFKRPFTGGAQFEPEPELFGATLAPTHRHPIPGLSAEPCTRQMGIRGPWYERLPHFRMDFTPSSGDELQSEYLVPRSHALTALYALNRLRDHIARLVQICEVRTIAADDLWMSPFYRQASVGFHFTWKKEWEGVRQLLPLIEEELEPFGARPHWGKLFAMPPERVRSLYPKLPDFRRLLNVYDPEGKFRNSFLDLYIFGGG